jgi:hypothetical protein
MLRAVQTLAFFAWASLSGCTSVAKTSLNTWDFIMCGADDSSEWSQLDQLPAEAETLRALATADYYRPKFAPMEWWIARTTDELILCRSDRLPRKSTEGAWWRYERRDGNWTVVDQNAWIVVT